ncbi:hypothetical protein RF11_08207 [Thelohanellus kitauei]|uniref:Uncharacterized protein n=1 Tax=Thelohanellus kitauei TaxID=669202 RepID=A0A0C2N2J0_THEKT|nr:hypothetical protein RF11_08207 [Thelohanellus kitauei]
MISLYENAANCYLSTTDIRVYECYIKAIDLRINDGQINKAIQHCFEYGYRLIDEHIPEILVEQLYRKGEDLRFQHNLGHTCVITIFDEPEIERNYEEDFEDAVFEAIDRAIEIRKKVNSIFI